MVCERARTCRHKELQGVAPGINSARIYRPHRVQHSSFAPSSLDIPSCSTQRFLITHRLFLTAVNFSFKQCIPRGQQIVHFVLLRKPIWHPTSDRGLTTWSCHCLCKWPSFIKSVLLSRPQCDGVSIHPESSRRPRH